MSFDLNLETREETEGLCSGSAGEVGERRASRGQERAGWARRRGSVVG